MAVTEAIDGLCDSMTMFAYSKDYPRRFLRATGHAMEQVDARCAALRAELTRTRSNLALCAAHCSQTSHPDKAPGMKGANAIKVVKADVMHDQVWDARTQREEECQ